MNKKKLVDAVENMSIQAHRSQEEQFFIRMVRQVWQIDYSVPPSEIWLNLIIKNQDYFPVFMNLDDGDEKEEKWLLDNWNENVEALIQKSAESSWKPKIVDTFDELNQLRLKNQK
jgi:hypothetical protein